MRSLRFRCVRLNWRQFIFAAFLVSLSACGKKKSEEREGQSGKATQKSSETQSISEEQVCERVAAFSHHGEQEELTSCKTRLTNMKEKMGKEKYEKFLACMVKASSKSEAKECAGTPGAFQNYVKRSKTAEVKVNLRLLHDGMRSANAMQETPGLLPALAHAGPTPEKGACCKQRGACSSSSELWAHETWKALGFAPQNHRFSYEVRVNKHRKSFELAAYGDLDCDGQFSTYRLNGVLSGEEIASAGEITSESPLE